MSGGEMRSRAGLLKAFLETEYRVWPQAGAVTVRIGSTAPDLETRLGQRPWAILTAFNPGGARAEESANREAHERMRQRLERDFGVELHPASNVDPTGCWPEEASLLAVEPGASTVHLIAREFGQLGVVAGRPGRAAELWLYGGGWPDALPASVRSIDR